MKIGSIYYNNDMNIEIEADVETGAPTRCTNLINGLTIVGDLNTISFEIINDAASVDGITIAYTGVDVDREGHYGILQTYVEAGEDISLQGITADTDMLVLITAGTGTITVEGADKISGKYIVEDNALLHVVVAAEEAKKSSRSKK